MTGMQPPVFGGTPDLAPLWRIVGLCLPLHEECGAATFVPRGGETLEEDWGAWVDGIYAPVLAPALVSLQDAASNARFTALLGEDVALGAALPVQAAQRSLKAGRRVLFDVRQPKGVKLLDRLHHAASLNPGAGHLVTVFAARAHTFHMPAVQSSAALLLAECVLGASAAGRVLSSSQAAELLAAAGRGNPPAAQLIAV